METGDKTTNWQANTDLLVPRYISKGYRITDLTTQKYCANCNMNFTTENEYQDHRLQFHGPAAPPTFNTNSKDSRHVGASCSICHTAFKRSDHMKRHMHSKHSTYDRCPVPQCLKYLEDHDLKTHIAVDHPGADKFNCRDCHETFHTHQELEHHEGNHLFSSRHTQKHVCPHCCESFTRKDHMQRHVRSKHTQERVECEFCKKIYRRRDHMTRHIREQHRL